MAKQYNIYRFESCQINMRKNQKKNSSKNTQKNGYLTRTLSSREIINYSFLSSFLVFLSYYTYSIHIALEESINKYNNLTKKLSIMEEKMNALIEINKFTNPQFASIINKGNSEELIIQQKISMNPEILQVLLNNAPKIILTIFGISVVYFFLPKTFTLKAFMPSSLYTVLQKYNIPGFVERVPYIHYDSGTNAEYLFTIINGKTVEPSIKLSGVNDYQNLYTYIGDLLTRIGDQSLIANTNNSNVPASVVELIGSPLNNSIQQAATDASLTLATSAPSASEAVNQIIDTLSFVV